MFHLLYVLTFFWVNGFFQSMLIRARRLKSDSEDIFLRRIWFLVLLLTVIFTVLLYGLGDGGAWILFGLSDVRYWELYVVLFGLSVPPLVFEYFLLARQKIKHLLYWGLTSYVLHLVCTLLPFIFGYGLREMLWAHIALSASVCLRWIPFGLAQPSAAGSGLVGFIWSFDFVFCAWRHSSGFRYLVSRVFRSK